MFGNDALVQELRDQLTLERARYEALFAKYSELRLVANPQAVGLPVQHRAMKPADEAIETVVARFPQWPGLKRQLQRFVLRERSVEGADEAKIADSVLHWRDPQNEDDDAAA